MNTTHKYIAYITIEADSPFAVGSGEKGITVDRLIARDALNLPYIPGTSLAGVLRHELDPGDNSVEVKELFGYQEREKGQGSRLVISSAHLLGADGKTVVEGISQPVKADSAYYQYFKKLPERDHVRINERGTVDGHGKFDEELVHKGTRFVFRMELSGNNEDLALWNRLLETLHQPLFRIGAGTRKGFGKLKIQACKVRVFNLQAKEDLRAYLKLSSSLNETLTGWDSFENKSRAADNWEHYKIELEPENFFLFAAGYGDEDVDNKPKTEEYFDWTTGEPMLTNKKWLLIPATSIKGALAHRIAFHYNKLKKNFISGAHSSLHPPKIDMDAVLASFNPPVNVDEMPDLPSNDPAWEQCVKELEDWKPEEVLRDSDLWKTYLDELEEYQSTYQAPVNAVGENNDAVKTLFGYALEDNDKGARGNVIISDLYLDPSQKPEKVFSHVAIDRFTGGARDGMLFQQKAASSNAFTIDIYVKKEAFEDMDIKNSFEEAIKDLCAGRLQLGGGTTKGHGVFKGSFSATNK